MGLSPPVQAAVGEAVQLISLIVERLLAGQVDLTAPAIAG